MLVVNNIRSRDLVNQIDAAQSFTLDLRLCQYFIYFFSSAQPYPRPSGLSASLTSSQQSANVVLSTGGTTSHTGSMQSAKSQPSGALGAPRPSQSQVPVPPARPSAPNLVPSQVPLSAIAPNLGPSQVPLRASAPNLVPSQVPLRTSVPLQQSLTVRPSAPAGLPFRPTGRTVKVPVPVPVLISTLLPGCQFVIPAEPSMYQYRY
jgi:hypothetical protein